MLQDASQMIVKPRLETGCNEMEEASSERSRALNRVQRVPGVAGEAGVDGCGSDSEEHGHIGRVTGQDDHKKGGG